jgi:hypothetical protein
LGNHHRHPSNPVCDYFTAPDKNQMTTTIQKDISGPDWPLGFINVATPGTPINFMANVDPNSVNSPGTPTSSISYEYTVRAEEIMVQAFKPASHGTQNNTGNIYIMRRGVAGGGNRDDTGSIVATLTPGQTLFFTAAAVNVNVWNPYRYFIDADNSGDGAFVTLIIQ